MEEQVQPPPPHVTTLSTLLTFNSPSIKTRASNLYDGHELRSLTGHLSQALTPRWSPRIRGGGRSNLFDLCELDAVVQQLNGALRATRAGTVIYSDGKSIGCLQKKSGKKQEMISGDHNNAVKKEASSGGGLVPKLWKKVRRAVVG